MDTTVNLLSASKFLRGNMPISCKAGPGRIGADDGSTGETAGPGRLLTIEEPQSRTVRMFENLEGVRARRSAQVGMKDCRLRAEACTPYPRCLVGRFRARLGLREFSNMYLPFDLQSQSPIVFSYG